MNTKETKKHIKELEAEIEALLIAVVREVASHQFYERLIKKHKSAKAVDVFKKLAEEESSHKKVLEKKLTELKADLKKLRKGNGS